jgi:hypothetical protein
MIETGIPFHSVNYINVTSKDISVNKTYRIKSLGNSDSIVTRLRSGKPGFNSR